MDRWPDIRDVLTYFLGFGVVIYETVVDKIDRPALLALAGALLGLPFFLNGRKK